MKNQQPSSTAARTPYYDTDNSQTSLTDRSFARNGVPPGTVASRVQFLQSLQGTSHSRPGPAPPATTSTPSPRRRENSRTGFGRRLTNRFGPPALQSGQPFEEARVDTSHSFLGLNTPRKSHIEEHGIADNRARYSKSPGINGTITPVVRERAQYDAVAPWGGLSRSKSSRSMGRKKKSHDMDGHRSDLLAYHGHIVAEATTLTLAQDTSNNFRQDINSNNGDTIKSESSFATTSTIRRQSVRDLFEDHGIERPEGLASSKEPYNDIDDATRPTRPHRFCHICAWVNSGPSTKCWRCSHRLCSVCDAQSPQPVTRNEVNLAYSENFIKSKGLESQPSHASTSEKRKAVATEPTKRVPTRPGPSPIQKTLQENTQHPQEKSSPPTKFSGFHPELSPAIKTSHASHPPKSLPKTPARAIPYTSKPHVTTSVKDSPFVIADSTAKKQSIVLFPFDYRGDRHLNAQNRHEHRIQHQNPHDHSSSSSSSFHCGRVDCRTSRCEHRFYRHAVSRGKELEKHYKREETENGYVADSSRVEDEVHGHSHSHAQASEPTHTHSIFSVPQPRAIQETHHTHKHQQESTRETCIPEFVECHGYPRTGHVRHGSCSGQELAGECQHCVEDCQCVACQSTHHSVRCCTHKDHKAMVHQHHTPRKEVPTPNFYVQPLSTPQRPSIPSSSATAVPPRSPSTKLEPFFNRTPAQDFPPKQELSPIPSRASLEKVPSVPHTQRSTFIKEALKPPTPPPWVSQPRSALLKHHHIDPIDETPNEEPPDPFAQLRKSRTPPSANIWGESNQSLQNEKSRTGWSYTYAQDRNENIKERQQHPMPSRKSSVVKEKHTPSSKGTTRSSSRIKVSPPGSRRASRRLSALFQLREHSSVPALTQKLLQHQEELRDNPTHSGDHVQAAPPGEVASIARNLEQKRESIDNNRGKPDPMIRSSRIVSRAGSTESTKKWRLRLVDKKTSPLYGNDNKRILSEHRLEDELPVRKQLKAQDRKVMSEARLSMNQTNTDEHECTWKRVAPELQNGNKCNHDETGLGIVGITIILHFDDRKDMILKAGSWTTTGEPRVLP